ncbi:zinc-binding dehydrogenase [Micromonospora sp. KC723]|uniref:zinc-binding dehydrogenase n=1 Tax=Micromonospora sp. KC723 TaxID=2530381 RepID=UPI001046A4D5|nr:hypothetical protein E1165_02055 [Micromonospora sp. KC723]
MVLSGEHRVVVDAAHLLPVPHDMDDLTAAAFPVSYATAHGSLLHRGGLRPGETVVTGSTGNVGEAALQVARARGARVVAVDRSGTLPPPAADHIVPPDGLAESVRRLTDGRGADIALDLVGGDLTAELLNGLSWEGRLVTTGFASGDIPSINLLDVLVKTSRSSAKTLPATPAATWPPRSERCGSAWAGMVRDF